MKISEYLAPPVLFSDQKSEVEEFLTAKSWGRKAVLLFSREGRALGEICAQGGLAAGKTVMTLLSAGDAAFSYCLSLPQEESEECKFTRTARLLEESGSHLLSAVSAVVFFVTNFFTSLFASSYCRAVSEALIGNTLSEDIFAKEEAAAESKPYWTRDDIRLTLSYPRKRTDKLIVQKQAPVIFDDSRYPKVWALAPGKEQADVYTPSLKKDVEAGLEACLLDPSESSPTLRRCRRVWWNVLLDFHEHVKDIIRKDENANPFATLESDKGRMNLRFLNKIISKEFLRALFEAGVLHIDVNKLYSDIIVRVGKRPPWRYRSDWFDRCFHPLKAAFEGFLVEEKFLDLKRYLAASC